MRTASSGPRAVPGNARAYVTLAAGDPRYLEMAADLALSLRRFDALPFVLVADPDLDREARARFSGVFSEVVPLDRRRTGRARKFGIGPAIAPFEESVFIDADCLALSDPAPIWEGASAGPLTMVGEMLGPESQAYHHGFSTRSILRRLGLRAYLKTNSGVFHVRRAGGAAVLEECARCYEDEVRRLPWRLRPWRNLGDELAFGVVGGRLGLGTFPHPGPMYWADEIRTLDPSRPAKPVLHFIAPIPEPTLDAVLDGVRARRRAAGLAPDASLESWRWKARRGAMSWMANQAIRRMVRTA